MAQRSKIKDLQARLGGGAMIMGGMKPGATRPIKKKARPKRAATMDQTALMTRATNSRQNRRGRKKKPPINFTDLEDDESKTDAPFTHSMSSDIDIKKTKPMSSAPQRSSPSSTAPKSDEKRKKYGMGMGMGGGMGGLLAKAGGFKKKPNRKMASNHSTSSSSSSTSNTKNEESRPRQHATTAVPTHHDYGLMVSDSKSDPIPSSTLNNADSEPEPGAAVPSMNTSHSAMEPGAASSVSVPLSASRPPPGARSAMGGMGGMMVSADMLNRNALKSRKKSPPTPTTKHIEVVSEGDGLKCLRLFAAMEQYVEMKKGKNGKGMEIESFKDTVFGKAMQSEGALSVGWSLKKLGEKDVSKMSLMILRNQLSNKAQMNKNKGYEVTFKAPSSSSSSEAPGSASSVDSKTLKKTKPSNAIKTSLKYEIVEDTPRRKVLRLYSALEKYVDTEPGPNGKGLTVTGHQEMTLQSVIDIGWRLSKLGRKNVTKSSKLMLRNQLMAVASSAAKDGYLVTFMNGDTMDGSQSLPASPLMASKRKSPNTSNVAMAMKSLDDHAASSNSGSVQPLKLEQAVDPFGTVLSSENVNNHHDHDDDDEYDKKEMTMDKIRSKSLPVSKADSGTETQRENAVGGDSMDDLDDQDLDALNALPDFSGLSRLQTDPAASMVDEHDQNITDKKLKHKDYDAIPSKATALATTSQSEGVIKPKVNQTASVPVAKSNPVSNSTSTTKTKSNVMTKTPSKYKIIPKKAKALPSTPPSKKDNEDEEEKEEEKRESANPGSIQSTQSLPMKRSKYKAPKTCELMEVIKPNQSMKVRLFREYESFFVAEAFSGNKGFAVQKMNDNEFGTALTAIGIGAGWKVTECGGKTLGSKMFVMLKNQIIAASKKSNIKDVGYVIVFENASESEPEPIPDPIPKQKTVPTKALPTTPPIKKTNSGMSSVPLSVKAKKEEIQNDGNSTNSNGLAVASSFSVSKSAPINPSKDSKPTVNVLALSGSTTTTVKSPSLSPLTTGNTNTEKSSSSATNTKTKTTTKDVEDEKVEKKTTSSSYEAPKSCEMVEEISSHKLRIKMWQDFDQYFSAEAFDGNKGFSVKEMTNNEFGKSLSAIGIGPGWRVTECSGKHLGHKMFVMLKNQIVAASKKNRVAGYLMVFENPDTGDSGNGGNSMKSNKSSNVKSAPSKSANKSTKTNAVESEEKKEEDEDQNAKVQRPTTPQTSRRRKSVEIVSSTETEKTVNLKHHIDKYIVSAAQKGPKGYRIETFNKMFGDDLKELGIEEKWRLIRIGSKEVDKLFYQMTKTNLDVEFRNNQNKGYQVTFAAPE